MELPKISAGMFDDLKSRFGRGRANKDPYADELGEYDDYQDYDEYPDYGEYGYDEERDGGYAPASSQYDPYNTVTMRSVGSSRSTGPRLVSLSDANRPASSVGRTVRDPLSSSTSMGRTLIDGTAPAPSSPAATMGERSESLDAVFSSTASTATATAAATAAPAATAASSTSATLEAAAPAASYDPYAAFTGASPVSHKPVRSCVVIRPKTYGDAEKVAKTLRAGDVAVLCLAQTPADLAKRILDFSFGAATALGASADCVADKVFVLAVGPGLDDQERRGLQSQGVLK